MEHFESTTQNPDVRRIERDRQLIKLAELLLSFTEREDNEEWLLLLADFIGAANPLFNKAEEDLHPDLGFNLIEHVMMRLDTHNPEIIMDKNEPERWARLVRDNISHAKNRVSRFSRIISKIAKDEPREAVSHSHTRHSEPNSQTPSTRRIERDRQLIKLAELFLVTTEDETDPEWLQLLEITLGRMLDLFEKAEPDLHPDLGFHLLKHAMMKNDVRDPKNTFPLDEPLRWARLARDNIQAATKQIEHIAQTEASP